MSSSSDAALARYRQSMQRSRAIYYGAILVIVAALGTWVGVAWSRGEVAHASLRTVPSAPPTLRISTPSPSQQQAWHSTAHIALGIPQFGGTLVTYSTHTVGGVNVRTGKPTWQYTRTDRTVCTAAQLNGTTIAVYARGGNCDELSAFESGTGARRWTRTLDQDGKPLNGSPQYQVTPFTFLAASRSVIYAVDPVTGYNRWTYDRFGCAIEHVVLGTGGALISQNCSAQLRCNGMKFCGRGPQLLLRDASNGRNDKSTTNPDQIKWNRIGDSSIPISADTVISSAGPAGRALFVNDVTDGAQLHSLTLRPTAGVSGAAQAYATDVAEIIWVAGVAYAVRPDAATFQWILRTPAPPVVASPSAEGTISLSTARITLPTSTGVGIVDGASGAIISRLPLPTAPPADSIVYSAGTGFLVTGPTGTVAYR